MSAIFAGSQNFSDLVLKGTVTAADTKPTQEDIICGNKDKLYKLSNFQGKDQVFDSEIQELKEMRESLKAEEKALENKQWNGLYTGGTAIASLAACLTAGSIGYESLFTGFGIAFGIFGFVGVMVFKDIDMSARRLYNDSINYAKQLDSLLLKYMI